MIIKYAKDIRKRSRIFSIFSYLFFHLILCYNGHESKSEHDKINADAFIMELASQLHYARKHGNKYDKINADAFIMEVASQFVSCAENVRNKYDKKFWR